MVSIDFNKQSTYGSFKFHEDDIIYKGSHAIPNPDDTITNPLSPQCKGLNSKNQNSQTDQFNKKNNEFFGEKVANMIVQPDYNLVEEVLEIEDNTECNIQISDDEENFKKEINGTVITPVHKIYDKQGTGKKLEQQNLDQSDRLLRKFSNDNQYSNKTAKDSVFKVSLHHANSSEMMIKKERLETGNRLKDSKGKYWSENNGIDVNIQKVDISSQSEDDYPKDFGKQEEIHKVDSTEEQIDDLDNNVGIDKLSPLGNSVPEQNIQKLYDITDSVIKKERSSVPTVLNLIDDNIIEHKNATHANYKNLGEFYQNQEQQKKNPKSRKSDNFSGRKISAGQNSGQPNNRSDLSVKAQMYQQLLSQKKTRIPNGANATKYKNHIIRMNVLSLINNMKQSHNQDFIYKIYKSLHIDGYPVQLWITIDTTMASDPEAYLIFFELIIPEGSSGDIISILSPYN